MKKINDVSHVADVLQSELQRRFMKYTAPGVDGHLPVILAATALDVWYRLLLNPVQLESAQKMLMKLVSAGLVCNFLPVTNKAIILLCLLLGWLVQPRVYNSKSVQLPYGFLHPTPPPGWDEVGNQQWICLAGTKHEAILGAYLCEHLQKPTSL